MNFNDYKEYTQLEQPVDFGLYEAIGVFPYSTASVTKSVAIPRAVFWEIETTLGRHRIHDNRHIMVFRDKNHNGSEDFVIYFKDMYAIVGKWEDVREEPQEF